MRALFVFVLAIGCNGSSLGPDAGYCPDPASGYTACGHACCGKGETQCTSPETSTCCPVASVCGNANDLCCGADEQCIENGFACCPTGSTLTCSGQCCAPGEVCSNAGCCPPTRFCPMSLQACCGDGFECGVAADASVVSCVCSAANQCGTTCCTTSQTCDGGSCVP